MKKYKKYIILGSVSVLFFVMYFTGFNSKILSLVSGNQLTSAVGPCPFGCTPATFTPKVVGVTETEATLSLNFININYSNWPATPTYVNFSYDKVNKVSNAGIIPNGYGEYKNRTVKSSYIGQNKLITTKLTGLEPNTTYYWGYLAYSTMNGKPFATWPSGLAFKTARPKLTTIGASQITRTSVVLTGSSTSAFQSIDFNYGLTPGVFINKQSAQGFTPNNPNSNLYVSLSGLTPKTTYYYNLTGKWASSAGLQNESSTVLSFTTLP